MIGGCQLGIHVSIGLRNQLGYRQCHTCCRGGDQDILKILSLALDLPTRHEIAIEHALTMQVKNAAFCKASAYGSSYCSGISTSGFCQQ